MKRLLDVLWRWEPMAHSRWELVFMRVMVALLIWDTHSAWVNQLWDPVAVIKAMAERPFAWDIPFTAQPHPNGLAMWMDVTWVSTAAVEQTLRALTFVSLIAYVAGVSAAWSLAIPVWFGILAGTLSNSQGAIGHMTQGLHQVTLGIWMASVWWALRSRKGLPLWRGFNRGQCEAEVGRQVLIGGYVVSAVSKLIESKALWFVNARYVPLHMLKNNEMKYAQSLDPAFLQMEGLSRLMLDHPVICQLLFGVGLPLELFAFVGLRNRKLAVIIGALLIFFHWSVMQLMSLFFFFNITLLLTFLVCPWWWLNPRRTAQEAT
ncbi:MAG: hypothetical protein JNJ83_19645 [Verrucomicrobiaceae bacterium]|nr:hypothetical protein [Verrucomicrobiaceae bacterium]